MKKYFLLPAIMLLCVKLAMSQTSEQTLYKIFYKFEHLRDTTERGNYYTEEMVLLIGQKSSLYLSQTKIAQDAELKRKTDEMEKSGSGELNLGVIKQVTKEQWYFLKNNPVFYTVTEFKRSKYIVKQVSDAPRWSITKETKKIKGYTCQKATTIFKGRNYTAWFTTDIAGGNGPWKLNGLPGTILEAYDNKNEVRFSLISVVQSNTTEMIALPADGIHTDLASFEKMIKGYQNSTSSNKPGSGVKVEGVKLDGSSSNRKNSGMNNPIEKNNR
ncbi:MAG: GLPGLI family protein [Chitinophagaceae bacterium]|nr:GLPGLI family protein [Chitinophagaceae bacterium]